MTLITETHLRTQLVKGLPNPFPIKEGDKLTPAAADFLKDRGISLRRVAPSESTILPGSEDIGLKLIPVGVSNRHVHLSPEHVEALFGAGYALTPQRVLSQKGQFAARETVTIGWSERNHPTCPHSGSFTWSDPSGDLAYRRI